MYWGYPDTWRLRYKSDLYIEDTNTIIEIKSLISTQKQGVFPSIYSRRALEQLDFFIDSLARGRKVIYIIVALNPYLSSIRVDHNTEFYTKYLRCIEKGMEIHAFSCKFSKDHGIEIYKRLTVE